MRFSGRKKFIKNIKLFKIYFKISYKKNNNFYIYNGRKIKIYWKKYKLEKKYVLLEIIFIFLF